MACRSKTFPTVVCLTHFIELHLKNLHSILHFFLSLEQLKTAGFRPFVMDVESSIIYILLALLFSKEPFQLGYLCREHAGI